MAHVSIHGLKKSFGLVPVLKGFDLEVEDTEFVALVGPSGCGKSTLLRTIAGLETQTEGHVTIGGRVVDDVEPKDRDIAMVFQNYALYPHMTVRENIAFALKMRRSNAEDVEKRIQKASAILGLDSLLDRHPAALSGGQRQRVAMGRALVRDPKVFLFDEPLSNLDAKLRVQMRADIKSLHRRLNATTIYVTHDQVEAMTMADKIVVMKDGLIEQIGDPLDLYDRPVNTFVAAFIGSPAMNLLEGHFEDGGFRITDGPLLPMDERHADATICGIRPEHMRLDPSGVELAVDTVEPTGSETFVAGQLGNQTMSCLFRERLKVIAGETLRVSPDAGSIHLFSEDGRRLP